MYILGGVSNWYAESPARPYLFPPSVSQTSEFEMDYCTFHSVRDTLLQKGERHPSSEFYKDSWLQGYKLKMKCNRHNSKRFHTMQTQ